MPRTPVAQLVKTTIGAVIAVALIVFLSAGALTRPCDTATARDGAACASTSTPLTGLTASRAAS